MGAGVGLSISTLNTVNLSSPSTRVQAQQRQIQTQRSYSSGRQELLQSGNSVRAISREIAKSVLSNEGYRLLDIRPAWEWEKAHVQGSLHVPLYVEDYAMDPITLLKKWVHFGYIGLWTGQKFTAINDRFVEQVDNAVADRQAKLLVACGEGLRSMMAVKMLRNGGYKNLGWLAGGFNRSKGDDFPDVEGTMKLQYATVGGVSYLFFQILVLLRVLE